MAKNNKKKKEKKIVKTRHRVATWFARNFVYRPFWGWWATAKNGVSRKQAKELRKGGPYLIVSNHISNTDPVMITNAVRMPVYYVATEVIFSMGLISKLLTFFLKPFPKSKSQPDISTVRNMLQISKEGGNVGIFVEGNATFNGGLASMPEAIGKVVLKMKRPILVMNFIDLYLKIPRWAIKARHSKIRPRVEVKRVIPYEEYKDLSPDQINDLIYKEIESSPYENVAPEQSFTRKHMAESLHRLLFMCPNCHNVDQMHGHDELVCKACGFKATYDDKGYINSSITGKQTLIEADTRQVINYEQYLDNNREYKISLVARQVYILKKRRVRIGYCDFILDENGVRLDLKSKVWQSNSEIIPFETISAFACQGKYRVIVYLRGGFTRMFEFNKDVNTYKILLTLQILKQRNLYKNGLSPYKLVSEDPTKRLGL